jgi:putative SOS response-associated peptidase YedK
LFQFHIKPIHDRMPVILHPRDYDRWLNDYDESRPPIDLLRPYEADGMRMTPVNRLVGNVHNNGPEMLNSA